MKRLLLCAVLAGFGFSATAGIPEDSTRCPQIADTVTTRTTPCDLSDEPTDMTTTRANEMAAEARADSLQRVVDQLTVEVDRAERDAREQEIWKNRAKYFNIGYVWQTLTFPEMNDEEWKSDFSVAISRGRTYYLHRRPIARMMKFGIDWTHFDVNYAKYSQTSFESNSSGVLANEIKLGLHQADIAMAIGPSFTINPVGHLKLNLYFRYMPTFSLVVLDSEVGYNYVSFYNMGAALSWKTISVGIESRWGDAKYNGISVSDPEIGDLVGQIPGGVTGGDYGDVGDYVDVDDVLNNFSRKLKTKSMRLYVSFRF